MDDLVQWLGAQLDEDERIARRACEYAEASWRLDEDAETVLWWPPEPRVAAKEREHGLPVVSDRWRGQAIAPGGERIAPHIASHDPARVLREIDVKRQLLARYEELRAASKEQGLIGDVTEEYQDFLLRLLALPYADRPGFREEWAP